MTIAAAGHFYGADAAQGEIIGQLEGLIGRNGAQAIQALLAGTGPCVRPLFAVVCYPAQIFFLGAEFIRQYALEYGGLRPVPPRDIRR